ncbi:hypothetical protein J3R82DRAFT_9957 [Butyriboletus roseoflavus]|nr:hypothetical protein J3R82DRAFT_9957 [Butyriboletus roseoflavus]
MPHKRAKRPAREQEIAQRATDLAPKISIEHEPIPKSVSRVLNAGQIRREYRKKRQPDGASNTGEDDLERKKRHHDAANMRDLGDSTVLRIKPSETVTQFNRRVENSMVPIIKTALRQSSAQVRRVRREEAAQQTRQRGKQGDKARRPLLESPKKGSDPPPIAADEETVNFRNAGKEFQVVSTSAPRRLNDIAQEPPVIKKLPRGATKNDAAPSGVLSMAQKAMMEEERDKAIRHYRELKARKLRESGGIRLDG